MITFKKGLCIGFVCLSVILLLYIVKSNLAERKGEILETLETEKFGLTVRITAYSERVAFVPGAFFNYEAINGDGHKTEIFTFRHDDPVPIDRNSVVFVNDKVAYVYMGWKYAVTVDGGKNWTIWDAEHNLEGWKCCNYFLIKDISLKEDGTGRMRLNGKNNEIAGISYTTNYGQTWNSSE